MCMPSFVRAELPFWTVLDPTYRIAAYFDISTPPYSMVVDPKTMTVSARVVGKPQSLEQFISPAPVRFPMYRHPQALALASLLLLGGCGGAAAGSEGASSAASATATDFALDDVKGGRFQLSEHFGKEVLHPRFLVHLVRPLQGRVSAPDRAPREAEGQGPLIVAISIDGPESTAQVRGDAEQMHLPFPVLLDAESRVVASYNPRRSAPYPVVIDRKGRVVAQHDGYTAGDEVNLAKEIEAAREVKTSGPRRFSRPSRASRSSPRLWRSALALARSICRSSTTSRCASTSPRRPSSTGISTTGMA